MKIRPEHFLIKNEEINFRKIFVTGSDEALINYVTTFIEKKFKKKNFFIDTSNDLESGLVGDLFSEKKVLFSINSIPAKNKLPKLLEETENAVLISSPNNRKTTELKKIFIKEKNHLLIDCYQLNRAGKETVIREYVNSKTINISSDVFWYIVERFHNEYLLLINQLDLLSLFGSKIETANKVEEILFLENKIEINKIFFLIYKKNNVLLDVFRKNILTASDFYIFLNSLKLYLNIISNSPNQKDALNFFPKYLFNEKDVFLEIYQNLNKEKIIKIYNNIQKIERMARSNSSLLLDIGSRFLLSTKKIITS